MEITIFIETASARQDLKWSRLLYNVEVMILQAIDSLLWALSTIIELYLFHTFTKFNSIHIYSLTFSKHLIRGYNKKGSKER